MRARLAERFAGRGHWIDIYSGGIGPPDRDFSSWPGRKPGGVSNEGPLTGPLPDEVRQYKLWQRRRLSVRPGLTCLWQVSGRNQVKFEKWMELDLEYIDNWSWWLDLKIMARTVPALLHGQ